MPSQVTRTAANADERQDVSTGEHSRTLGHLHISKDYRGSTRAARHEAVLAVVVQWNDPRERYVICGQTDRERGSGAVMISWLLRAREHLLTCIINPFLTYIYLFAQEG